MGDESRAGVHEHTHEDRSHGKRDDVDREEVVLHHQRHQDREERDHRIEHGDAAWLLEVVLAEEREVGGEHHHEDEHEDDLSDDGGGDLVLGGTAAFHLLGR